MNDNVVILDHYRQPYAGNGALQALVEIIAEYSDAVEHGQICDIANIIVGELWVFGYKIVPLNDEDLTESG